MTVVYIVCCGAAVTSVGLAFATWFSRLGRAVALTITLYVGVAVGWLFLGILWGHGREHESVMMLSPFFGPGEIAFEACHATNSNADQWWTHLVAGFLWSFFYITAAGAFLVATLATFNRCLGRVETGARFHEPEPHLVPVRVKPKAAREVPV